MIIKEITQDYRLNYTVTVDVADDNKHRFEAICTSSKYAEMPGYYISAGNHVRASIPFTGDSTELLKFLNKIKSL